MCNLQILGGISWIKGKLSQESRNLNNRGNKVQFPDAKEAKLYVPRRRYQFPLPLDVTTLSRLADRKQLLKLALSQELIQLDCYDIQFNIDPNAGHRYWVRLSGLRVEMQTKDVSRREATLEDVADCTSFPEVFPERTYPDYHQYDSS
ncbi:hypothetical protein Tco_1540995 [Tanacetum coccineum]